MSYPAHFVPDNPHVCPSCACLMDDLQDPAIIETALPYEKPSTSRGRLEVETTVHSSRKP